MSFNIDIECGQGSKPGALKIYCASLTDTWDVERNAVQMAQFHSGLAKEDAIVKNKINLGQCPKTENIDACEQFLSRLGCTAAVLRVPRFHEFLGVPQSVRDGLTYASHKPYGKSVREGYMQRHPRFVRRGGGKRFIRLTKDDRGGSLICFLDENNKNSVIASLKIGASTGLQNLKDKGIPNAFVLKSGKRQWVLQASSTREYNIWQAQLVGMLKEFGPVNLDNNDSNNVASAAGPKKPSGGAPPSPGGRGQPSAQNTGKLLKENQELNEKIKKMRQQISNLASEIDRYKDLEIEMKTNESELKRKGQKKFQKEKEDLIAKYEVQQDNLRAEIEELHRKLEQKTADEAGRSGLKTLFNEDDYMVVNLDDYKEGQPLDLLSADDDDDDDDDAGGAVAGRTISGGAFEEDDDEDLGGDKKYLHKHLHRHDHKHIHEHRHTHIHDQTGDEPITYTHTHTICHTITHTMTQFKIKKRGLGL